MLRIAPQGGMPPMPPEDPSNDPSMGQEGGSDSPTAIDQDELGLPKLDPMATGYMGSESGPFECEHCLYWEDPNACHIVAGDIDPHGCCNLLVPKSPRTKTENSQEVNIPQATQEDLNNDNNQ